MGLKILEQVRDQLKNCNAVSTDREFCEQWLGKSECYLRTLRYGDLCPSADAMMTCASKLNWYSHKLNTSQHMHHKHWAGVFEQLRMDCVSAVEQQALHNWQSRTNGSAVQ